MGVVVGAAAVLKLYAIGMALCVLTVIYGLADSFGGLMYSPDHRYINELNHQTQRQLPPATTCDHMRGWSPTKNIGS